MKKPLSTRTKILINVGVVIGVAVMIAVVVFATRTPTPPSPTGSASAPQVLRENSHRLSTAADGKVTVVEFLDFECEACGAVYPVVEDLREEFDGEVTFVTRYFPIPSHTNAVNSAVAAEAAARQGQFEAMYSKLFETQTQWGEQPESRADLFRTYAEDIGLDLELYDADIQDPAVLERVMEDQREGTALGVQGTPTFFLNGEQLELSTLEAFRAAIEGAVRE